MTPMRWITIISLLILSHALTGTASGQPLEHRELIQEALPRQAYAQVDQPRKLLVFTRTLGARHPSIPYGVFALRAMGEATGAFTVEHSEDPNVFTPENLKQYDAICFLNTSGELFDDAVLKESLMEYIRAGGGFIGIHGATDTFYEWPEYGRMIGAYFHNHPWNPDDTVVLKIEDPNHPVNAAFDGETQYVITEEIYQFQNRIYSRDHVRVLISLDTENTDMEKEGIIRTDGDFPVSWIKTHGAGRVFYCSLGHREDIYWNAQVLGHFLAGIQFAMGDLAADVTPSAQLSAGNNGTLHIEEVEEGKWLIMDGGKPVVQFNHGHVPPPDHLVDQIPPTLRDARGNYLHPIHSPDGTHLTADWPLDHVHHRGVYWAWPEVDWGEKRGNLHAVAHIRAHPLGVPKIREYKASIELSAQSQWIWSDETPIVHESVTCRVHPAGNDGWWIDLELEFTALADDVLIARQDTDSYGGLNIRLGELDNQQMLTHTADPDQTPRRSWGVWQGVSPMTGQAMGLAVFEQVSNPYYPNDWVTYGDLPWLQPTFPARHTRYRLTENTTLRLAYRLWVFNGHVTEAELNKVWHAYQNQYYHADIPGRIFEKLINYQPDDSSEVLRQVEAMVRTVVTTQRDDVEHALIRVLKDSRATDNARVFACEQLYRIGGTAALPVLLSLLDHPSLSHASRYALLAIPGEEVDTALLEALDVVHGLDQRIGLINLIAERRVKNAVPVFAGAAMLPDIDRTMLEAIVAALGQIGSVEAATVLRNLTVPTDMQLLRADAQLNIAWRLLHDGLVGEATGISEQILHRNQLPEHVRVAALQLLLHVEPDRYMPLALSWLTSDDMGDLSRETLADLIAQVQLNQNTAARVMRTMARARPATVISVIGSAAAHGNHSYRPVTLRLLRHHDEKVMLAAIRGLAVIGGVEELEHLLNLATQPDPVGAAAYAALAQIGGEGTDEALLGKMRGAQEPDRLLLVRLISDRRFRPGVKVLLQHVSHEQRAIRAEALRGLEAMAEHTEIEALLDLIKAMPVEDKPLMSRCILALYERTSERVHVMQRVINALAHSDPSTQVVLLTILSHMGGSQALSAVVSLTDTDQQTIRESAIRTLADWREVEALPVIIEKSREMDDLALHVLLIRGGIRLLGSVADAEMRDQYLTQLAESVRRDQERQMMIASLAQMASPSALAVVVQWQMRPAIKREAEMAIANMVLPDETGQGGMWDAEIEPLLQQAIDQSSDEVFRKRLRQWIVANAE